MQNACVRTLLLAFFVALFAAAAPVAADDTAQNADALPGAPLGGTGSLPGAPLGGSSSLPGAPLGGSALPGAPLGGALPGAPLGGASSASAPSAPANATAAQAPTGSAGAHPVSASFFQTDLSEAVGQLATQAGVNIFLAPDVQGVVTAQFQNLPLEQALTELLAPFGYTFRWTGSFYLIAIPDPHNTTFGLLSETRFVKFEYTDPSKAVALLSDYYRSYVKADKDLGVVAITAPPNIADRIEHDLKALDTAPAQLRIHVVITQMTHKAVQELGIGALGYKTQTASGPIQFNMDRVGLTFSSANLLAKLNALAQTDDVQVRADPEVLVTQNQPFQLFIGQKVYLAIGSDAQSNKVQELDNGLQLNLKVLNVAGDDVQLSVAPSLTNLLDTNTNLPVQQTTNLSTVVRIKAGTTAVLATMNLAQSLTTKEQTPLLGQLPLLGWLFKDQRDNTSTRELVVFVTPTLMTSDDASSS